MHLINTRTLQLEEVLNENAKAYAILSHRWGEEEVTFQDMQNPAAASRKQGYVKIQRSCENAAKDGYGYVWIDTCCINKESSAELTEAINSMFRWYQASEVCYALMTDIRVAGLNNDTVLDQFKKSRWFTRGWTLQELLAPHFVVFYDEQWQFLGTKQTLSSHLTLRTRIDEEILNGEPLDSRSIAQKMSWAAHRETTRVEDRAYSLLGIFGVNMPMLYGEGERAFFRLQEEIIKQSDDHTIFAWPISRPDQPGLLADNPEAFEKCQHIRTMVSRKGNSSYSMTNRGLSIKLMATPFKIDTYLVRLDCADGLAPNKYDPEDPDGLRLGMFVRRLDEDDQHARVMQDGKTFWQLKASTWDREALNAPGAARPVEQIEICVRQKFTGRNLNDQKDRMNGFRIASNALLERSSAGKDRFTVSAPNWDPEANIMSLKPGDYGTVGLLDISKQNRDIKAIKLGFDFDYNPVCFVAASGGLNEKTHILDRHGQFNLELDSQQAQWTRAELAQHRAIYQRGPFDKLAWSEMYDGTASALRQHSGLWAVKGDRIDGLNVRLGDVARLIIARSEFQRQIVWNVFLDNMKSSVMRKVFK